MWYSKYTIDSENYGGNDMNIMNMMDNVIKYGADYTTGNKLYIDKTKCYAYKGAEHKVDCYRVFLEDGNSFLFHCSCYETFEEAINGIKKDFPYFEKMVDKWMEM